MKNAFIDEFFSWYAIVKDIVSTVWSIVRWKIVGLLVGRRWLVSLNQF